VVAQRLRVLGEGVEPGGLWGGERAEVAGVLDCDVEQLGVGEGAAAGDVDAAEAVGFRRRTSRRGGLP
jgi:hypothetical protein